MESSLFSVSCTERVSTVACSSRTVLSDILAVTTITESTPAMTSMPTAMAIITSTKVNARR